MNEFVVYLALVLLGACFGSFAGATVWRLRARQLAADKKQGEDYDKTEYQRLKGLVGEKTLKDRSRCLECGYTLKWYDLIPVVSWLSLKGRCRSCRRPIGRFELAIELGVMAFFVLSYLLWPFNLETPLQIVHFTLWLVAGVVMAVLLAYDYKWFLLPDRFTIALAVIGAASVGVLVAQSGDWSVVVSALGAVLVLGGLYFALNIVSKGQWVGMGDAKLGVGLGLLLADWRLAFAALFLANFIGCLIVIPQMITKRLTSNSRVPFGPLLILGTIITLLASPSILGWYDGLLLI